MLYVTILSFYVMLFTHKSQHLTKQAGRYAHFREQNKKQVRWFGCSCRATQLGADLDHLKSHPGCPLHIQWEALPICRQAYMGCESKTCTKLG